MCEQQCCKSASQWTAMKQEFLPYIACNLLKKWSSTFGIVTVCATALRGSIGADLSNSSSFDEQFKSIEQDFPGVTKSASKL